jgi:virginiamycin A acetyltransferase
MPAASLSGQNGPDPAHPHPFPGLDRVGFLKPLIDAPHVVVGDYTYYDDPDGPQHFVERCVTYHSPAIGDRLIIGRFCAIATGVQFIMNASNHRLDGLSTYPFAIFGQGWEDAAYDWRWNSRGDTIVGNDVWIGTQATIMPGIEIGDGAVIGAKAVVGSNVPPYAVVAGSPARVVRQRFDAASVARLRAIRWWDWPAEKITRHLHLIRGTDIDALERAGRAP